MPVSVSVNQIPLPPSTTDNIPETLVRRGGSGEIAVGNITATVTAAGSTTARSLANRFADVVNVKDFGAVGDGVVDDVAAIQSAVDAASSAGGGVVFLPAGTYGVSSNIVLKTNVVLRGAGMMSTTIYQHNDTQLLTRYLFGGPSPAAGSFCAVEHMTLHGYADRNPTLGSDSHRLANIGDAEYIWYDSVRALYSRQMSLTGNGSIQAYVTNCWVQKSNRDAINMTGCRRAVIADNQVEECGDDAIAYHISSSESTPAGGMRQAVIHGNRIQKSFGIKVLGATNVVISNNTGRFCYGYGIYTGSDSNEGRKAEVGVAITGNTFVDTIFGTFVGAGSIGTGIYLAAPAMATNTTAYPHHVSAGDGTNTVGIGFSADNAFNTIGTTFVPPSHANVITGNTFMQTLSGLTNFSDSGFGQLFNNGGPLDPAMTGTIGRNGNASVNGIRVVEGALSDFLISENSFYGLVHAVNFTTFGGASNANSFVNGTITGNRIVRCVSGLQAAGLPANTHSDVRITNNFYDLDPLFESADRNVDGGGQKTGMWNSTTGLTAPVLSIQNVNGVFFHDNTVKNAATIVHANQGLSTITQNTVWCDTTVSSPSFGGVAVGAAQLALQRHVQYNADPRSTAYRTIARIVDMPQVQVGAVNGQAFNIETASTNLTGLSGATATATNLIPAGSIVFGVTVRVTTGITGATTFDIGDGTDVDRWGAARPIAAGTTTTAANFTITSVPIYASATSVVLTANGSNFTAGDVRVTVHFARLTAATT